MWPGVPFLYFNEKMADVISISKIPSIFIESSFSWETLIAAFLSGLVPAAISFYVIKKNNENIRYQQKQEYNRHLLAHLRIAISNFASQVDKVRRIHFNDLKGKFYGAAINIPEIMLNAINEMEGAKASLLISIPEDGNEFQLRNLIVNLSSKLSDIRGKDSYRYRGTEMEDDIRDMNWAYDCFISGANRYLSHYSFYDFEQKHPSNFFERFKKNRIVKKYFSN